ncbi:hypothetical protein V6N12_070357 [Hibiscus sabdariffa]|uniref:RNase H type-1 domain-containing protein n=1 Tax=Hibiscus sabdariffa TaxID=183260 RepID=A0ABR2FH15_9ROSI
MATIPLPRDSYGEDRPCWRLENNQKFWLKSAYASSHSTLGCDNSHEVESLEHVLRHYTFAANVEKNDPTTGFGCVQLNGLGRLLSLQFIATHNGPVGCDMLQSPGFSLRHQSGWLRRFLGWVKGNTDGVVDLHSDFASCGGVLRYSNGDWCMGFSRSLGRCSVLMAEIWAVHDMLKHAWSLGYRQVEVETDNSKVYAIVSGKSMALHGNSVVQAVQSLFALDWDIHFSLVNRDHNRVTDALARLSRGQLISETLYTAPPPSVRELITVDK